MSSAHVDELPPVAVDAMGGDFAPEVLVAGAVEAARPGEQVVLVGDEERVRPLLPKRGVAPEVVVFAALATAGMPFLLLVGAAPNAIAYESKQFTSGEFFLTGIPASILLLIMIGLFTRFVWPLMGMPVVLP